MFFFLRRCGCGRYFACHYYFEEEEDRASKTTNVKWSISHCTATFPTDSYGVLKFCGVADYTKAQYVRLDFTSDPDDIWQLLVHAFGFEPPKLVITIHGGGNDFEMTKALKREFESGLLQVATTTSAWIITSGVRAGVTKQVAAALCGSTSSRSKQKFFVIGIAPWGLVRHSEKLIGENRTVTYYPFSSRSRYLSLCEGHSCFLLVDNGTMGRSGAELLLRRRFEEFLRQKTMLGTARLMPLVCLVIGGGRLALHSASNYMCSSPPVPVVVCKHSGRAADLLASAYEDFVQRGHEESFKTGLKEDLRTEFDANDDELEFWFSLIEKCASKRNLARNMSAVDRLNLLLTWNREDMMHAEFEQTVDWKEGSLDPVFMEALIYNRVEIVRLLLTNGVAVEKFLTPERLEALYNTDKGPPNTLSYLIQDVIQDVSRSYSFRLTDIGLIIEKLIGYGYRAAYRRREFRIQYKQVSETVVWSTGVGFGVIVKAQS
ncbi:unnamed protein product [Soboliphyme baturini]|uniref:LSDAT_euk domain-containing protein n=1 Tax=Soboliphyme baturini TaxID=241478 RepID=A0A183IYS4_9BILA|nr:unnamed protein product [Soboliphyme baturini]